MTQTSVRTKTNFKQTFRICSLLVVQVQQSHHMEFSIDFIQQVAWALLARLYRVFSIVYLHYLNELIKKLDYYLENNHICLPTYILIYLPTICLSIYLASIFLSPHLSYLSIHLPIFLFFLPFYLPSTHLSVYLSGKVNPKSGKTLMSYS